MSKVPEVSEESILAPGVYMVPLSSMFNTLNMTVVHGSLLDRVTSVKSGLRLCILLQSAISQLK